MGTLSLLNNQTTAGVTKKPKLGFQSSQNLRGAMAARLRINREKLAVLTGTAVYDPASLVDAAGVTTTVTVTGAALGDLCEASFSLDLQGITFTAWVSAANTVSVRFQNESGGTLDLASGTITARVMKTPAALTIYGANVANPWANRANTGLFRQRNDVTDANLAVGDYQFLSGVAYAAFSNYNWLVMIDEYLKYILEQGATVGYAISSGTGTMARLDFASGVASGDGATLIFDTAINYDSLVQCNLQVKVTATVKTLNTDFTITDNGSGLARLTFTVAPPNVASNITWQLYPKPGMSFGLSLLVPAVVKAATTLTTVSEEVATKDAMWAVLAAGVTGQVDASLEALGTGG